MSIGSRTTKALVIYSVTDITQRSYQIDFPFLNEAKNVTVYHRTTEEDGSTVLHKLALGSDYTVELNEDGTNNIWGTVVLTEGLTVSINDLLTIVREIPVNQETTFSSQTVFSSTMDYCIDKLTALIQDMQFMNNTIHTPPDDKVTEATLNLGTAADRAGKLIGFDNLGKLILVDQSGDEGSDRYLRIPLDEYPVPDLRLFKEDRKGKILCFDENDGSLSYIDAAGLDDIPRIVEEIRETADEAKKTADLAEETAKGKQDKLTAKDPLAISEDNVISVVYYSAGENITFDAVEADRDLRIISAKDTTYTAGENITISEANVISATGGGATYTAGENITISDDNVISAKDTTYTAGDNITISEDNVISAKDTTYTAGENITIGFGIISCPFDTENFTNAVLNIPVSKITGINVEGYQEQKQIVVGNGKIVCKKTSPSNYVRVSEDNGGSWTSYDVASTNELDWNIVYGTINNANPYFEAIYNESNILFTIYSRDGKNWEYCTAKSFDADQNYNLPCWVPEDLTNSCFLSFSVNGTGILKNSDGKNWSKAGYLPKASDWKAACYGGSPYGLSSEGAVVLISSDCAAMSRDLSSWTVSDIYKGNGKWKTIAYGDGRFMSVDGNNLIVYHDLSDTGRTWFNGNLPGSDWGGICYIRNRFVVISPNNATQLLVSDDKGESWKPITVKISGSYDSSTNLEINDVTILNSNTFLVACSKVSNIRKYTFDTLGNVVMSVL